MTDIDRVQQRTVNHTDQIHEAARAGGDEGRASEASHQATRRILLGPIGVAFALLLLTVLLALGATALIAGSAP